MQVSITKAVELTGVSRTTIYNDKNSGKLTVGQNAKGKPVIDIAELERVYGSLKLEAVPPTPSKTVNTQQDSLTTGQEGAALPSNNNEAPLTELALLRQQIAMLQEERERERKQFEGQIESLNDTLTRAQEGQNKATMLLEHHQKAEVGEWEKSVKALESRITNQEKAEKEREERELKILRQNQALKKALQVEKNKSFWKKIFG